MAPSSPAGMPALSCGMAAIFAPPDGCAGCAGCGCCCGATGGRITGRGAPGCAGCGCCGCCGCCCCGIPAGRGVLGGNGCLGSFMKPPFCAKRRVGLL